jgi:hypothetical protein
MLAAVESPTAMPRILIGIDSTGGWRHVRLATPAGKHYRTVPHRDVEPLIIEELARAVAT